MYLETIGLVWVHLLSYLFDKETKSICPHSFRFEMYFLDSFQWGFFQDMIVKLLCFANNLGWKLVGRSAILLVVLKLSAIFNTINHGIPLSHLMRIGLLGLLFCSGSSPSSWDVHRRQGQWTIWHLYHYSLGLYLCFLGYLITKEGHYYADGTQLYCSLFF